MSQMDPNALNIMTNRVWQSVYDFLTVNNGLKQAPTLGTVNYGLNGTYLGRHLYDELPYEQFWNDSYDNTQGGSRAIAMGSFKKDVIDSIDGGKGSDIIYGGWGDTEDFLGGGGYFYDNEGGDDVIFGGGGNNGIATYAGNDLVVAGWDLATNPGVGVTFLDTWINLLDANTFSSSFKDRGGNNTISTGIGNDTIITGYGDDVIVTGSTVPGHLSLSDDDLVFAGAGNDKIYGGRGDDTLFGEDGNDVLIGDSCGDVKDESVGDDDVLFGGAGNDKLYGEGGNDILIGGAGADSLYGGSGIDTASYETSIGGVQVELAWDGRTMGNDAEGDYLESIENLVGSSYDDRLKGDLNNNVINGGGGNDVIDGGYGHDSLLGDMGNDEIYGGVGNDTLWGGAGNDILAGGAGADYLIGGDGVDLASYAKSDGAVKVHLNVLTNGYAIGELAEAAGDRLQGIENLLGSSYNDEFIGDNGNNAIDGGAGNDIVDGWVGNDTLWGGAGNDTLIGNSGVDHLLGGTGDDYYIFGIGSGADFVYENTNEGADFAYLTGITSIGVYKNGNDLWLAASNDDVMVLADWYISNNVEYVYFQASQELFTTQTIAQYAQDITPTATAMLMANTRVQDVPSIINTDIQLSSDIIALAGIDTVVPVDLA